MSRDIRAVGLSSAEIDSLLNPLLSLNERQSSWRPKPLGVQARKVQLNWLSALKGPLSLGVASCIPAFFALIAVFLSEEWRAVGITVMIFWYFILIYVIFEMRRLDV